MKKKLVTVQTAGVLRELRTGVCGPIMTPMFMGMDTIKALVYGGKKVYEVNPMNRKERILLTRDNVEAINFGKPVIPEPVDFTPVVVEPVVTEEPEIIPVHEEESEPPILQQVEVVPDVPKVQIYKVEEEPVEEEVTEEKPEPTYNNYKSGKKNRKNGDFNKK